MHPLGIAIPIAAAPLLRAGPALAQTNPPQGGAEADAIGWIALAAGTGVLLIALGVGGFIAYLIRQLAVMLRDRDLPETRLALIKDLPLGLPEGTIRALLAILVGIVGLPLLLFSRALGLDVAIAGYVNGIIISVFSFYFGTRVTGPDAAAAREARQEAAAASADAARARAEADTKAAAARTEGETSSRIGALRQRIRDARVIADTVGTIVPGSALADRARSALDLADRAAGVLDTVANADSFEDIADAAKQAGALVAGAEESNPLSDLLGGAASAFAPVLGTLGGAAGLAGPLGIAGAVVLGAAGAFKAGDTVFRRWIARILDRPYTTDLFPEGLSDGMVGLSALRRAPIFLRVYGPAIDGAVPDIARARRLLVTALRADAAALLEKDQDLPGRFESAGELEQGLQEFRRALIEFELDRNPLPAIRVPLRTGTVEISQAGLRAAMDAIGADRSAAQDRDQLALAAGNLARTGIDMEAALRAALPQAEARAAAAASGERAAVAAGVRLRNEMVPEPA